jgi:hypothetical protein
LKLLYLLVRVCTPGSIINFLSNEDTSLLAAGFFISGEKHSAVLLSEEAWRSIEETLYLTSIQGMKESIIAGM